MGLFEDLFGNNQKNNTEDFGLFNFLEEEQKREVKKGNYNSYNFEEEEKEDDDYYYEDDE